MAISPLGVLIVHGFTSSLDSVRGIREALKPMGLPTRMPVLRGHGAESPDALRGVRWQDWVADGEASLGELRSEAERIVIVGHSMGTLVTVALAANHAGSSLIDSIVVAAPAVQLAAPLAPGRPLSFLAPLVVRVLKRWDMPPNYADKSLERFDTNYPWAPVEAIREFLAFSKAARERLPQVTAPTLIMQSRNDSTVAPESAEIVYREIGTSPDQKRIVWFEHTEHEMFRDCEREATIQTVVDFVKERVAIAQSSEPVPVSAD